MAKKFNKGRQQKRNIDRNKLEKYRKEISRELGIDLSTLMKDAPGKNESSSEHLGGEE